MGKKYSIYGVRLVLSRLLQVLSRSRGTLAICCLRHLFGPSTGMDMHEEKM